MQIIKEFRAEEGPNIPIIPVSTPSYSASHEEGYARALQALVQSLAEENGAWQEGPSDHRIGRISGGCTLPQGYAGGLGIC